MSRSTRTHSMRAALAVLTSAALTFVIAAPAVADPPELIAIVSTPDYELALSQADTNPNWFEVDVTNTSGAAISFGMGAALNQEGVIEWLWQDELDPATSSFGETVPAGEHYHDQVPNWPGMSYEFFVDAYTTPTPILSHTVDGDWFPVSIEAVDAAGDGAYQVGYPVTFVPETARAGESVVMSTNVDAGLTVVDVRIVPAAEVLMNFNNDGWDWDASNATSIGSLPVTGTSASGSVLLPGDLAPGEYAVLVGDPVTDRWVSGPRVELSEDGAETLGLTVEAGAPRGSTPMGTDVGVSPVDSATGSQPVTFSFDAVTAGGTTTVTTSSIGPAPSGFELNGTYYGLSTTATFSGAVTVCISYEYVEDDPLLSLYHFEGGAWQDITTSSDPGVVCGETTSFSPFALGVPTAPPTYPFGGFYAPVSNTKVNTELAGSIVPFRFSLGGDQGKQVITSVVSGVSACAVGATPGSPVAATAPLGVKLQYAKGSGTYWWFWQTKSSWAGTCRTFVMTLDDGTSHSATFKFQKLTLGNLLRAILKVV
jgi:hypothetical protein